MYFSRGVNYLCSKYVSVISEYTYTVYIVNIVVLRSGVNTINERDSFCNHYGYYNVNLSVLESNTHVARKT